MKYKIILSVLFIFNILLAEAQTIYVSPLGSGDGRSWAQSANLEKALKSTTSTSVLWLQEGTYYLQESLQIPSQVILYGGFKGTESQLSERNHATHPCILDAQSKFRVANMASHSRIDGVTLQHGFANSQNLSSGGGVYMAPYATLYNCKIISNKSLGNGGAVYAEGDGLIYGCLLTDNQAAGNGGAIYGSSLRVLNSTISQNRKLVCPSLTDVSRPFVVCKGEHITLSIADEGTYLWSTGQTSASIDVAPLTDTTYRATVKSKDGRCLFILEFKVEVHSISVPLSYTSIDHTACSGGWNGSLTMLAPIYKSYAINGGVFQDSPIFSNLAPGTYAITAKDIYGCVGVTSATVDSSSGFPILNGFKLSSTKDSICFNRGGLLTLTPYYNNAGTDPTYAWSVEGQRSESLTIPSPTLSTTYSVSINNTQTKCVSEASQTITVLPVIQLSTEAIGGTICVGGTHSLTVEPSPKRESYFYQWQHSADSVTFTDLPQANTSTYSVLGAQADTLFYRCVVSSSLGICPPLSSQAATVKVLRLPTLIVEALPSEICLGDSSTLAAKVTNVDGSTYHYTWSGGEPAITSLDDDSLKVSPIIASTYSVSVSNGTCSSPLAAEAKLRLFALDTLKLDSELSTLNQSLCPGTSMSTIIYILKGGAVESMFTWQGSEGAPNQEPLGLRVTNTSISGTLDANALAGLYTWTITTKDGKCQGVSATGSIRVNPLPVATVSAAPVDPRYPTCIPFELSASAGAGDVLYFQEYNPNATLTDKPSPQKVSISGTYYYRARSTMGCWGNAESVTVEMETFLKWVSFPPETDEEEASGTATHFKTIALLVSGTNPVYYWLRQRYAPLQHPKPSQLTPEEGAGRSWIKPTIWNMDRGLLPKTVFTCFITNGCSNQLQFKSGERTAHKAPQ